MHVGISSLNLNTEPVYDPLHIAVELSIANEQLNDAFDMCDKLTNLVNNINDIFRVGQKYGVESMPIMQDLFGYQLLEYSAEGLWEGIKKFFGAIWNAISGFFKWIWNGIKRLFGGGKIPGTEEAKAAAEAEPKLAALIDTSATGNTHAGLKTILDAAEIISKSGKFRKHANVKKAIDGVDVAKLEPDLKSIVDVYQKTVENVKGIGKQAAEFANNENAQGSIDNLKNSITTAFNQACATIADKRMQQAIISGSTEGLQEYVQKKYTLKIKDAQALMDNINKVKALTDQTQNISNSISGGLKEIENDLIKNHATQDGQVDEKKSSAIQGVIMVGFQELKRILGIFQGLYNYFLNVELKVSESSAVLFSWYQSLDKISKGELPEDEGENNELAAEEEKKPKGRGKKK